MERHCSKTKTRQEIPSAVVYSNQVKLRNPLLCLPAFFNNGEANYSSLPITGNRPLDINGRARQAYTQTSTFPLHHNPRHNPALQHRLHCSLHNKVSKTNPLIQFHHLPIVDLPLDSPSQASHMEDLTFQLIRLNNPLVHQALETLSQTCDVKALILDVFCTAALQVADQLDIPCYYFFTGNIAVLALTLYFPAIHKNTTESLKDLKISIDIPGLPPVLGSDMPQPSLDRNDKVYQPYLHLCSSLAKSQGILINSFESLEPRALKAISDGLCVPDAPTPPIFSIGPLLADNEPSDHECLQWLDMQPSRSVVYLCFGSLGLFSEAQLKEIATGLENSGERFLWVVRSPPTDDKVKRFLAPPEPDLKALLPEGFLERTKDRGQVVKSWAPQAEILMKDAVGGFVTHCGWNSVLEAISGGVPMLTWPLYAEQKANKVFLVEEMKIALPMDASKAGFVKGGEVEKRVKQLMSSEEGKLLRERTAKMGEDAKAALSEGGSSVQALNNLAQKWNAAEHNMSSRNEPGISHEQNISTFSPNVPKLESLPAKIRTSA